MVLLIGDNWLGVYEVQLTRVLEALSNMRPGSAQSSTIIYVWQTHIFLLQCLDRCINWLNATHLWKGVNLNFLLLLQGRGWCFLNTYRMPVSLVYKWSTYYWRLQFRMQIKWYNSGEWMLWISYVYLSQAGNLRQCWEAVAVEVDNWCSTVLFS